MLKRVKEFIGTAGMTVPGDLVIVSVSGGPDSVALLHLLHHLAPELRIRLHVFHMEHGLRGKASAEDARYVQKLAGEFGLPATVVEVEHGLLKHQSGSLQANARALRYREIEALADRIGANRVAMGHNRDDQAETVLMRFLRGAGPQGLAGIPPLRAKGNLVYIRPLLETPRAEIEAYCKASELFPRIDASNLTLKYQRNRIRLKLLPFLARNYNPAIAANLAQTANLLRAEDQFLSGLSAETLNRCRAPGVGVGLIGRVLSTVPVALARRVVRLAAREALNSDFDLGLEAVTRVLAAAASFQGTHRLDLPGGLRVIVEYGVCWFAPSGKSEEKSECEWPITLFGETTIPELGLKISAGPGGSPQGPMEAVFDVSRLPGPLMLRLRRPGDRIWPVGMDGSKKLQDILVDAKVPLRMRNRIPLLVSGPEVLWVVGYRLDRRFVATPDSDQRLFLHVSIQDSST